MTATTIQSRTIFHVVDFSYRHFLRLKTFDKHSETKFLLEISFSYLISVHVAYVDSLSVSAVPRSATEQ